MACRAALLVALAVLAGTVQAADRHDDDGPSVPNNGQDQTRPRSQAVFLYDFVNQPGPSPDSSNTFTFRTIHPVPFDAHWSGSLRVDVPLALTNAASAQNPEGRFAFGLGDVLTQAAAIYTLDERWAFAAGAQFTFPTASRITMGSGKYVALPGAFMRCMLPELSPGSFFAPEMLYAFDVGGDPDRAHLSQLQLAPTLNWQLPRNLFVNLFPSTDIRIGLGRRRGGGRLFFPFDVLAGLMVTPRLVTTLEVSVPIVQDLPVYDFKLEAQVAWFFD